MRSLTHKLLRLAMVGSLTIAGLASGTTAAYAELPPNVHVVASKCQGSRVIRCIELRYDTATGGHYRAWASVWDADGGNNYFVKVKWVTHRDNTSAWQDIYDVAHGTLFDCDWLGSHGVLVAAEIAWLHPDGTYEDERIGVDGNVCW